VAAVHNSQVSNARKGRGYWPTLVGALVGGLPVATIYFLVLGTLGLSGVEFSIAWLYYGSFVALFVGAAIGIAALLAIFKYEAPIVTGIVFLPITVIVLVVEWRLIVFVSETIGSVDVLNLLLVISLFLIPLMSRWVALNVFPGG